MSSSRLLSGRNSRVPIALPGNASALTSDDCPHDEVAQRLSEIGRNVHPAVERFQLAGIHSVPECERKVCCRMTAAVPVFGLIVLAAVVMSGIEFGRRAASANRRIDIDNAFMRIIRSGVESVDSTSDDFRQRVVRDIPRSEPEQ